MLPLRERDGRADLFCMSERRKLSAKICIATQKEKKKKKKNYMNTKNCSSFSHRTGDCGGQTGVGGTEKLHTT